MYDLFGSKISLPLNLLSIRLGRFHPPPILKNYCPKIPLMSYFDIIFVFKVASFQELSALELCVTIFPPIGATLSLLNATIVTVIRDMYSHECLCFKYTKSTPAHHLLLLRLVIFFSTCSTCSALKRRKHILQPWKQLAKLLFFYKPFLSYYDK